uniref:Uncharacterized protein n=1 Tax=Prolemur simus TaxID=1328070 RepID=A0A8C8YE63_PROSS
MKQGVGGASGGSGRSERRESGQPKRRKWVVPAARAVRSPLSPTRSLTVSDHAPGDPDPHQCLSLRDETEATQVMAETGEGSLETVALPPPQLLGEGGVPRDPAVSGHAPQLPVGGGRGPVALAAGREQAPPPTKGLKAASVLVAAESRMKNGFQDGGKAPKTCGAEGLRSEVMGGAEEEDGKSEKCTSLSVAMEDEEREEAGPGPVDVARCMQSLEALQLEMDSVQDRFGRMRRHYLERRRRIIQNIPSFWLTALRNHPQLSPRITGQDAEMLRYLTNLEVKELRRPRTGCKFKFFFQRNPYFRNNVIIKKYEVRFPGPVVSVCTPLIWCRGHEPQFLIGRNQDLVYSFFTWFSDHTLPEFDRIAEIIKEDLWQDPLRYYVLGEGIRGKLKARGRNKPGKHWV